MHSRALGRASKPLNLEIPRIKNPFLPYPPFLKPFDRVLGKLACPNNCWLARMEENYLDNSSKLLSNLDNSSAKLLSNFLDEKLLS